MDDSNGGTIDLGDPNNNGIPPGYTIDPSTGQLVPVASQLFAPTPGSNPNQVVNGNPWPPLFTPTPGSNPNQQVLGPGATPFVSDQPVPAAYYNPPPAPAASSGGGAGAPDNGTTPTPFDWPQFQAPPTPTLTNLQAPSPYTFTPFSYAQFAAPTLADAQNQPGYQFGLQQGQGALLNSAASLGVARGGGTLKSLFDYTNAAAEQNYGNVFNQNLSTYNTNEGNAFNTWAANNAAGLNAYNTNFGVAQAVNTSANNNAQSNYENQLTNATDTFNPQFNAATLTFSDMYNRWLAKLNSLTTIASGGGS